MCIYIFIIQLYFYLLEVDLGQDLVTKPETNNESRLEFYSKVEPKLKAKPKSNYKLEA